MMSNFGRPGRDKDNYKTPGFGFTNESASNQARIKALIQNQNRQKSGRSIQNEMRMMEQMEED